MTEPDGRQSDHIGQEEIDANKSVLLHAITEPAVSDKQDAGRSDAEAKADFDGIPGWKVGQTFGADADQVQARIDETMPVNAEPVHSTGMNTEQGAADDDETVQTLPWPTLSDAALLGTAGRIVKLVAPHTEADPAALLVQLLAVFGATLGPGPHLVVGNERHQAIIHPLIVGRTNRGAKGTGLALIETIRKSALPEFDACTASGLSTAEGLIERVRDPSGTPDDKDFDPGANDKRLLVRETEYKSVLVRQRRDGNTLAQTLRACWDCQTLRTLTRKRNRLTATLSHIVVIGHITPREFRATLRDSDLAGGTVNRQLICLSRRSRLHSRLGNLPEDVLKAVAEIFRTAHETARKRGELEFTDEFWEVWDGVYSELNRDRADCPATDATARAATQVLRLVLLYALLDGKEVIDTQHLEAALALWTYAEDGARWLFSSHELERQRAAASGLATFILEGGQEGRTRTEVSRDYFKGNKTKAAIDNELGPLVHDGVVIEMKDETRPRPTTRYVHRALRIHEFTKRADQLARPDLLGTQPTFEAIDPKVSSSKVDGSSPGSASGQHISSDSLVRNPEARRDTISVPVGGLTTSTPGQTDRVQRALARARCRSHHGDQWPQRTGGDDAL